MNTTLQVSRVDNVTSTETRDISVERVIDGIRTGGKKLKGRIEQIRNRMEMELTLTGDFQKAKKVVSELKKQLPGVLWSGTFSKRDNASLVKHSGLLPADLDSLGSNLAGVRDKLLTSPHLWALFKSPSGYGLKAVFRVPADAAKHSGSFRAVEKHVLELTGVQIDESGKDVARLCFMSYDPELYHNPCAKEIEPLPELEKPKAQTSKSPERNSKPDKAQIREMLSFIPKRPRYPHWIPIVAAVGDALPDRDAIELLQEWSPEEKEGEYTDKLRCRLKDVHIGTLIYLAKQHGWTPREGKGEPPSYPWRNAEAARALQKDIAAAPIDLQSSREVPPVELPPAPTPYVPPPLTLLPSVLQEYIHAAAKSLNVDLSYIFLPMLSALGSAIGNTRSILLKRGFFQPPIIWTSIIGRTGTRKSPSLDTGCFAVMEQERNFMKDNKTAMELYDEELAEWESKSKKERGAKPEPPVIKTCLMDDLTLAALADALQTNPRGVLVEKDELSHWFSSFDQFHNAKGADVSRWLSLHTGVFFGFDRRTDKRRYRIWQPRVGISGGIQPSVLSRVLTLDFFERGLPARFIFAYPPFRQDRWSEATVPDDLRNAVLELFEELWLLQPDHDDHGQPCPKLLHLDKNAKAEYVSYYNQCGAWAIEAEEHEEAAWCKLSGYAARFALVGQLLRDVRAEKATGEVMQAACALARWGGNEAARIYAALAESPEQRERRKLMEFIGSRGGRVRVKYLITNYRPLKNQTKKAEQQLEGLVKIGLGKWEPVPPTPKGGQPTREFQLLRPSAKP